MAKNKRKEITVGVEKTNYLTWAGIVILPIIATILFFAVLFAWHLKTPELNQIQTFVLGTGMGIGIMTTLLLAYSFYQDSKGWGDLKKTVWKKVTVIEEAK